MKVKIDRKTFVYTEKKRICIKHYGGICSLCHKVRWKGGAFHHLEYIEGEKTYADFKGRGKGGTIAYNIYILPIVEANPHRFIWACNPCHTFIETVRDLGDEKASRLWLIARVWTKK